jgi:hypothetical protein
MLSLADEIRDLESKKKEIVTTVMSQLRKTAKDWFDELETEDFKTAIESLYAERYNKELGTNHFTWNTTDTIQHEFVDFVKELMKSDETLMYYPRRHRFFRLKKFRKKCTTRSSVEMEFWDVNTDGNLVYNYNGTAYHGFGSVDSSVQQKLTVDVTTLSVTDYQDSTMSYQLDRPGIHRLDNKFIDKLIKKKIVKIK